MTTRAASVAAAAAPGGGHAWSAGRVIGLYTWAMAALTALGAAGLSLAPPVPSAAATWVMLALVAVVGLPHGAYDLEVGRRWLSPRFGRLWAVAFGLAYLLLAGLGVAFWVAAPWAGLAALLVGGALHWGADDLEAAAGSTPARLALAACRGAVPVALPLVFHPARTAEIFSALTGGGAVPAAAVRTSGLIAIAGAMPGLVAQVVMASRSGRWLGARAAAEVAVLTAWFAAAGPLLAFTVYFCLWHSARHSLRSMGRLGRGSLRADAAAYGRAVLGPTLATWALAALAWAGLEPGGPVDDVVWRVVFVGLFALTVPHVVLELAISAAERGSGRGAAPASE